MKNILLLFTFLFVSTHSFGQWVQVGKDIIGPAEGSIYGADVSLNALGNRVALFNGQVDNGASGEAQVYEFTAGSWSQIGQTVAGVEGTNNAGNIGNVVLNAEGNRFVFGNPFSNLNTSDEGAVRVFEFQNGSWIQLGQTILGDNEGDKFGTSVDIAATGDRIIVSASKINPITVENGYARVYELQATGWVQIGQDINSPDGSTMSVSIAANGGVIAVAEPTNSESSMFAGKVRTLMLQNNMWQQIGEAIFGENAGDRLGLVRPEAGSSINLNNDGSVLAVGAFKYDLNNKMGQVRIFQFQNNQWGIIGSPITSNSESTLFGSSLELNGEGNTIVIGDGVSARLYTLSSGDWQQKNNTLTDNNPSGGFGSRVAINQEGNRVVVGALNFNSFGKASIFNDGAILSTFKPISSKFNLYPNPNNGIFDISFTEIQERVSINIVDLLGRQIVTIDYFNTNKIDVNENLKTGVYLVEIIAGGVSESVRIVIE